MGASAVKLLLYYRSDYRQSAQKQLGLVDSVARECITYDIPFLVEPVSYAVGIERDNPREFARLREQLVISAARDINQLPVDVLKSEFPADLRYKDDEAELVEICRELDASSRIPWVLLSAGVDFDYFYRQVEIGCKAGASGFIGGRAIWQEAMSIDNAIQRRHYLSTVAADRLKRLTEVAVKYAVPWYKKLGMAADSLADISEGWYLNY
jgi:tagatose 1,6-diphosphate aldolase